MMMKKILLTAIAALLALSACNKPATTTEGCRTYSLDELRFDFTIEKEEAVKGVRDGWLNGDRVFVFFGGHSDVYVTVTYDGSAWSAVPQLPSGMNVGNLAANGEVTAVYLPYGNSLEPTWNGSAWVFPGTNDYYYLQTQKAAYFITDMEDKLPTLGAYLYMETADDYVQFYIHDENASGSIRLACNYLVPGGIAGISLDGTITDAADASDPGGWITARADTIDGDEGYYASGRLILRPGYNCYLAMDTGSEYKHYFKQRESVLSPGRSYILPAYENWLDVSSSEYVTVAGGIWSSVNVGANNPWESGSDFSTDTMGSAAESGTSIPIDADWNALLDRTKASWIRVSIAETEGFLVIDRADPDSFMFIHCDNYWSSTSSGGNQHFFISGADGTHEVSSATPPSTACVRLLSTTNTAGLEPPVDGGGI